MSRPPAHAPLPVYDWDERPGSPFPWLVVKAKQVRAERLQAQMLHHAIERTEHARNSRPIDHEAQAQGR